MITACPSIQLVKQIEASETMYMADRMTAIQERENNPEGIELQRIGNAVCLYSKTMPWPSFNTVKGITDDDIDVLDEIIAFYRSRDRKVQLEIVPGVAKQDLLEQLARRGMYPSGYHTSLFTDSLECDKEMDQHIRIEELQGDQFDTYAMIHCRGTGLSDDGIPFVAANNRVLYDRPGWKFFIGYYNETPAAAGVMYQHESTVSFTFAATLPEYRNLGLQQSLLKRRMEEARKNHCTLAVGQCSFLSQSHRNMERVGMKIGYVRSTWTEL